MYNRSFGKKKWKFVNFLLTVSVKTRIINQETSKMDVYYVHKINLLKETSNFPNLLIYSSLYNLPATDILFTEKSFRPYLLFLPYRARSKDTKILRTKAASPRLICPWNPTLDTELIFYHKLNLIEPSFHPNFLSIIVPKHAPTFVQAKGQSWDEEAGDGGHAISNPLTS